jgi:hypothetical protein
VERVIRHMPLINAQDREHYYLHMLLTRVTGATNFEYLQTVNGQLCETFQEAFREHRLLQEDRM